MFDYVVDIWVEDRHRNGAGLISQFSMLSNGPKLQYHLHDLCPRSLTLMDILLFSFRARFLTFVFVVCTGKI
jgi:hypothetical protein